eukprot:6188095-Pleurochrysis_carterae.AAC.2
MADAMPLPPLLSRCLPPPIAPRRLGGESTTEARGAARAPWVPERTASRSVQRRLVRLYAAAVYHPMRNIRTYVDSFCHYSKTIY